MLIISLSLHEIPIIPKLRKNYRRKTPCSYLLTILTKKNFFVRLKHFHFDHFFKKCFLLYIFILYSLLIKLWWCPIYLFTNAYFRRERGNCRICYTTEEDADFSVSGMAVTVKTSVGFEARSFKHRNKERDIFIVGRSLLWIWYRWNGDWWLRLRPNSRSKGQNSPNRNDPRCHLWNGFGHWKCRDDQNHLQ